MFKVYKKSVTISLTNVKMLTRYQKNKEMLRKEVHERYQNLSKEEKNKNMHMKSIKIFLKKKKIKYFSIVINTIKSFLKMKNKGQKNRRNYYIIQKR